MRRINSPKVAQPLSGHTIGSIGDAFVIAEWQDPGGHTGYPQLIAPVHVHHSDDEAWYVREGTLCVRVGEDVVEARAGSCVFMKRGTAHTYWNPGPGAVRYLLIMTPKIFRLIEEIHAMPDGTAIKFQAVFEKYDSQILDT